MIKPIGSGLSDIVAKQNEPRKIIDESKRETLDPEALWEQTWSGQDVRIPGGASAVGPLKESISDVGLPAPPVIPELESDPSVEGPPDPLEFYWQQTLAGAAKGPQPIVDEDAGELPWYADVALAGAVYGVTAVGLAYAGAGVGALGTSAVAAPIYMGIKSLITGHAPRPHLTKFIPGSENIPSAVLGTAEEYALWMVAPYLFKGASTGAKYAARGIAKGVQWAGRAIPAPVATGLEKAGEWTWKTITVPTRFTIPIVKKSMAEMLQPAVERLEKNLPEAAGAFRENAVERSLLVETGREFGKRLEGEAPEVLMEVQKGLGQKHILSGIKNPRARSLLTEFSANIRAHSVDEQYERAFRDSLTKLFPSRAGTASKETIEVLSSLETKEGASVKQIHGALREIIHNPTASEEAKTMAKDLWNLPAKTPLEVARASRTASFEYLTDKIKSLPGAISPELQPGYTVSKFGALKGAIIHKDIELELQAMYKLPKIAQGIYNKFFLTPWKTNKVILRPASHMRNLISNTILNDWGGLPFWRVDVYMDAWRGMKNNEALWQKFQRLTGVSATNIAQADLANMGGSLRYGANIFEKSLNVFDRVVAPARRFYNMEESWFKYAKFLHNVEKKMPLEEAAADSIKWTFNFSEVTPEVARIGKYAMPFVRWYSKVIPLGMETAVKHPVRFGKWLYFGQALQSSAMEQTHVSDGEWDRLRGNMPEYMQRGQYLLMPWRDAKGHLNMLDLTNTLPFVGDASELFQKSPLDTIAQNPIFTAVSAIKDNKKFSGAPLYHEWENNNTKWAKIAAYGWEQLAPSLAPGGTDWRRLHDAMTGEGNYSVEQAMASAFGFRIVPIDDLANRRKKRAIRKIYEAELRRQLKRDVGRSSSERETREIIERYRSLRRDISR